MANKVRKRADFEKGRVFEVVSGDLLAEESDAVVNAANSHLAHGAGVALAIAGAAGFSLTEEGNALVRERGEIPVGEAAVTNAGRLPFKGVIHAVGPRMGEGDEQARLTSALYASFLRAHERGWASVSFPGVSSGIFSVPHGICARAYVDAVEDFWGEHPDTTVKRIRLVLFEGPLLEEVLNTLPGGGGDA